MREASLGVDLSDVIARVAVVDPNGQVLARAHAAPDADLEAHAVREAVRKTIAASKATVRAVGVAIPGAFDEVPPKIAAALREATPRGRDMMPIAAGTAAALAEQWVGAARGLNQVATIAIAEHVSAGVLINGEPWAGANGFASSIAWLAMNPVEREDYRRFGSLEAEVGAAGIVRRFVWRIKSGDESVVSDKVKGDFTRITAAHIFEAGRNGDGVSISVVRDTVKYVGMAAANLATVLDPEMIVIGGVIADSGDGMLDQIKAECVRRLHPRQSELLRITLSTLGSDAVAIGAARAAARAGS